MKRIASITTYLTVMSTLAVAQLPIPSPVDDTKSLLMNPGSYMPTLPAQQANESAPLNNFPFFPGGKRELETYLQRIDLYPHQARETYIEGTVRVRFRVLPSGYLNEVRVVRSHGPLLDQAAIQAVVSMPRWYPAHREGVAVSSQVELPVTFRLD